MCRQGLSWVVPKAFEACPRARDPPACQQVSQLGAKACQKAVSLSEQCTACSQAFSQRQHYG